MQMTYRKAIIILDRLVTTERIEVDREELREAVKVAQKALNIVADLPPNHGRLIDADVYGANYIIDFDKSPLEVLESTPTIIKAEVNE